MTLGDHHALIGLNALLIAFTDADTNAHRVADVDVGDLRLLLRCFEFVDQLLGAELRC